MALATSRAWPGDGSSGSPYVLADCAFGPSFLRETKLHLEIAGCAFSHDGGEAISLSIVRASNVTLRDVQAAGILLATASHIRIENSSLLADGSATNPVVGEGESGPFALRVAESDNVSVSGSALARGLAVVRSRDLLVERSRIQGTLFIESVRESRFADNEVIAAAWYGVVIREPPGAELPDPRAGVEIERNNITAPVYGVSLFRTAGHELRGFFS